MSPDLRRTPTREFLLNRLESYGSLRIDERRYTMSLRIMEQHGYVSRSIGHGKWSLNRRGREALERWQA